MKKNKFINGNKGGLFFFILIFSGISSVNAQLGFLNKNQGIHLSKNINEVIIETTIQHKVVGETVIEVVNGLPKQILVYSGLDSFFTSIRDTVFEMNGMLFRDEVRHTKQISGANVELFEEHIRYKQLGDTLFYLKISGADTLLRKDFYYSEQGSLSSIDIYNETRKIRSIYVEYERGSGFYHNEYYTAINYISEEIQDTTLSIKHFDDCNRLLKIRYYDTEKRLYRLTIFSFYDYYDCNSLPLNERTIYLSDISTELSDLKPKDYESLLLSNIFQNCSEMKRTILRSAIVKTKKKRKNR